MGDPSFQQAQKGQGLEFHIFKGLIADIANECVMKGGRGSIVSNGSRCIQFEKHI